MDNSEFTEAIDALFERFKKHVKQQEAERVWKTMKDWCGGFVLHDEDIECEKYDADLGCIGTFTQCPAMKEGD